MGSKLFCTALTNNKTSNNKNKGSFTRSTLPKNSSQATNAWRVLFLLFLANLFNFFDRTIPAIIIEPIRRVLAIPTFGWLVLAGLTFNFATYACNSFMVPMLQRYFLLPLQETAVATGIIVGVTGLVGLTAGGWIADKLHQRFANGRLMFAAVSMLVATLATGYALHAGRIEIGVFVAVFGLGWLFAYNFYTCVYTAIQDVVEPRLRATAMALFFAGLYLLGGGLGPVVVGLLSDHFAHSAMAAAGALEMAEAFKAVGLHDAMYLIPVALFMTLLFLHQASRCFSRDAQKMRVGMAADEPEEIGAGKATVA